MDLVTLLQQYHEAGNQDRIYEDATAALEAVGYDVELAGAWLLGRDAFALSSLETRKQLHALVTDQVVNERLVIDMSRALQTRDVPLDYSRILLDQFIKGFTH